MKQSVFCWAFALFFGFAASTEGAKAPDFSVRDYNGNLHRLYADYLDQNKVVVLKFFFVACPPCNAIAPTVQQAYVRWGEGRNRVQFIELSILHSDNNAMVRSYSQTHKLTFPGVGGEGGSKLATAPYESGQFGSFRGTPSFAVIAPDGEVNYPVSFSKSNQAALDTAIAQALRRSGGGGGGSGSEPCTRRFNFEVVTKLKAEKYFLEDLVHGHPSYELPNGQYDCEFALPQNIDGYYLRCERYLPDNDPLSNVSTVDILLIQRHLLGIERLTNLQIAVGDVNNSGSLTTADMAEIRRLILGHIPKFTRIFTPYASVHDPFGKSGIIAKRILLKDVLNNTTAPRFGIGKYGDVSGANNFHSGHLAPRSPMGEMVFYVKKYRNDAGTWQYDLFTSKAYDLLAFQFGINASTREVRLLHSLGSLGFNPEMHSNFSLTDKELRLAWNAEDGLPVRIGAFEKWFSFESDVSFDMHAGGNISVEFLDSRGIVADKIRFVPITDRPEVVWYSPLSDEVVVQSDGPISEVSIFDLCGRSVPVRKSYHNELQVVLHPEFTNTGVYIVQWKSAGGTRKTSRVFVSAR